MAIVILFAGWMDGLCFIIFRKEKKKEKKKMMKKKKTHTILRNKIKEEATEELVAFEIRVNYVKCTK